MLRSTKFKDSLSDEAQAPIVSTASSRPRKRGALHNQDAGEVGRTSNPETPERLKMRKEHRRVANTLRVERTQRLEGSRFVAWQLYGLVAGRLPGTSRGVAVLWAGCTRRTEQKRWVKHCVGSFPGAACY
jgi:hypothetical protein